MSLTMIEMKNIYDLLFKLLYPEDFKNENSLQKLFDFAQIENLRKRLDEEMVAYPLPDFLKDKEDLNNIESRLNKID